MRTKDDGFNPRLAELVELYIKTRAKDKTIDPAVIAEMVMRDIDKAAIVKNNYPQIYFAARDAIRQTARAILRRRYPRGGSAMSAGEREEDIPGLETDRLQRRYPEAHRSFDVLDEDDEEDGRAYVLREFMTEEDWLWNLGQFDKAIIARQKHREQLKRWGIKNKGWSDPDEVVGFGT